jgi:hypothetical protein
VSVQDQPKWAWWVVGIVIPLIGIAVSLGLVGKSDSDGTGSDSAATSGGSGGGSSDGGGASGSSNGSASGSGAPASAAPKKLVYGPVDIKVPDGSTYLELDGSAPLAQPTDDSAELAILLNVPPPSFVTVDSAKTLAVMPADGPEPTAADCVAAVAKRGTYDAGDATVDGRYCMRTGEGRIAYLQVTSVSYKAIGFRVTVWE